MVSDCRQKSFVSVRQRLQGTKALQQFVAASPGLRYIFPRSPTKTRPRASFCCLKTRLQLYSTGFRLACGSDAFGGVWRSAVLSRWCFATRSAWRPDRADMCLVRSFTQGMFSPVMQQPDPRPLSRKRISQATILSWGRQWPTCSNWQRIEPDDEVDEVPPAFGLSEMR